MRTEPTEGEAKAIAYNNPVLSSSGDNHATAATAQIDCSHSMIIESLPVGTNFPSDDRRANNLKLTRNMYV